MNHFTKVLALFSILFFFSCGPDYILDETREVENATWNYSDTLNFEIGIQDSMKIYNLYVEMEHSTEFSSQNMYVMIHTTFPSGKRISEQLSLEMANKLGIWHGDCDSEWCTLQIPIQEGAFFNAIGKHTFTIEQFMRVDSLPGIKNISFKIEDTGQSRS